MSPEKKELLPPKTETKELPIIEKKELPPSPPKKEKTEKQDYFFPTEDNPLFWIFFIIVHQFSQYHLHANNRFVVANTIKYKIVENIKSNSEMKNIIKTTKLMSCSEFETNLIFDSKIHINTLILLLKINHISFIIVKHRTFYESVNNSDDKLFIILYCPKVNQFGFRESNHLDSFVIQVKKEYYQIVNIIKPIQAIAQYKVDELQTICHQLQIQDTKKKKLKKDLYEDIQHYFQQHK